MEENKKCSFCGEEIEENAEKCPHCGEIFVKDCPFCGEKIKIDAIKCKHCGEWLESTKTPIKVDKNDKRNKIISILTKCIFFVAGILMAIALVRQFNQLDNLMFGDRLTREHTVNFDEMGTFTTQWQENNTAYGRLVLKDTYIDDMSEKRSGNFYYYIIARLEYPDGRIISKDMKPIPYNENYIDFTFNNVNEEEATDISNGKVQVVLKEKVEFSY